MTSLRLARRRTLATCALAAALSTGCARSEEKPKAPAYPAPEVARDGKVVAKIGDVELTTTELERRIVQQSPFLRTQLERDPEQRKKFVENEIRMEILAQEGWKRGLHSDPKVLAELRRAIVTRMMRDKMQELQGKVDATEQDLADAYKKKESEYVKPEKIRLSVILAKASTDDAKKAATKRLEALRTQLDRDLKRGNDLVFATAARQSSEDEASKAQGGDLQFLSRAELDLRFGEAAGAQLFDKVEVGELAVLPVTEGVALVRKTGKRRAVEKTLEMVKPQIRSQVLGEKKTAAFDAWVEELKKKDGITVDESAFSAIRVESPQLGGPAPVVPHDSASAAATGEAP